MSESTGGAGVYSDLLASVKTGRWGADLQPYLKELGTQTGAEFVVWVVMFKDGSKYVAAPFVHRLSDGLTVGLAKADFNIELSNLRVGVAALSKSMVDAVASPPEDKAVVDVELGPEPVVVVAKKPDTTVKEPEVVKEPYVGEPLQPPPDAPPSEEISTWTYIAAGGAVIVAGALVAGGIYLLSDSGNESRASGFDAIVSW
ncbi:MAG: hypothetical protein R3E66_15855 [bacterium]